MDYHSVITSFIDNLLFILLAVKADGTIILGALLFALMTLSFFIAAGEVALFSLHSKDINMLKTKQHSSARRIVDLLDEPKEVYTSLLIAGTFFNICIIVLSNFLINELFHLGTLLVRLGSFAYIAELVIKVFMIAFILVFFCRILPKVWATQNNLRVAYDCSYVIEGIHLLLVRISRRMVAIADVIGKKLGATKSRTASLQELDEAIDITTDEETSVEEKNILKGIVKFFASIKKNYTAFGVKYFPINGIFTISFASIFVTNQAKKPNNSKPELTENHNEALIHFTRPR